MATDYSDYEFLKVEVAERVATITINRPDSLNAVNNVVHHELEQIWIDVRADRTVGERRLFARLPEGMPDGLTVDVEGGVWVAVVAGPGEVVRFKSDRSSLA